MVDARRMLSNLTDALGRATRRAAGRARQGADKAAEHAKERVRGREEAPLLDLSQVDADEALFLVRVMIASSAADGVVDESERDRIQGAMREAGLDPADRAFLDDEIAWPRDIEEIADAVGTPEKAERAYAAARLVIEPDTMQEREFLRLLAERMDLTAEQVSRVEARAGGL